jgi:hypothetical protein
MDKDRFRICSRCTKWSLIHANWCFCDSCETNLNLEILAHHFNYSPDAKTAAHDACAPRYEDVKGYSVDYYCFVYTDDYDMLDVTYPFDEKVVPQKLAVE